MGWPSSDERVGSNDDSAGRSKKEDILAYVRAHPGAHLREIKRRLNLGMGTVQYHLYTLEREGKVASRRQGLRKRFYLSYVFGEKQQQILDILAQEPERDILLYVVEKRGISQKDLAYHMGMSPATINWHMKRLNKAGLVEIRREEQFVRYFASADRAEVTRLLRAYHPAIWEKLADRLADLLAEIGEAGGTSGEKRG